MPANLTPEYYKAEKWYRSAATNDEKILALERMLSVMPKHKGTDHLKADLRRKLSKLKEVATQKGHGKQTDIFYVPHTGAGQVVLLGVPNCGKSAIVDALTNAKVTVAEFPFATTAPVPGMVQFEDVQFQLIDMPPVTADYIAPGQVTTYRNCDLIAIVIDLADMPKEQLQICLDFLESRNLILDKDTAATDGQGNTLARPAFCICTKTDSAPADTLDELRNSCRYNFEFFPVSIETSEGIEQLPAKLFGQLGIIRIYSKPPGKKPDFTDPFTLRAGSTVLDLAHTIHRELAEKLKSARLWGTGVHDGQNVHKTHILHDKDIVELHFA